MWGEKTGWFGGGDWYLRHSVPIIVSSIVNRNWMQASHIPFMGLEVQTFHKPGHLKLIHLNIILLF